MKINFLSNKFNHSKKIIQGNNTYFIGQANKTSLASRHNLTEYAKDDKNSTEISSMHYLCNKNLNFLGRRKLFADEVSPIVIQRADGTSATYRKISDDITLTHAVFSDGVILQLETEGVQSDINRYFSDKSKPNKIPCELALFKDNKKIKPTAKYLGLKKVTYNDGKLFDIEFDTKLWPKYSFSTSAVRPRIDSSNIKQDRKAVEFNYKNMAKGIIGNEFICTKMRFYPSGCVWTETLAFEIEPYGLFEVTVAFDHEGNVKGFNKVKGVFNMDDAPEQVVEMLNQEAYRCSVRNSSELQGRIKEFKEAQSRYQEIE